MVLNSFTCFDIGGTVHGFLDPERPIFLQLSFCLAAWGLYSTFSSFSPCCRSLLPLLRHAIKAASPAAGERLEKGAMRSTWEQGASVGKGSHRVGSHGFWGRNQWGKGFVHYSHSDFEMNEAISATETLALNVAAACWLVVSHVFSH